MKAGRSGNAGRSRSQPLLRRPPSGAWDEISEPLLRQATSDSELLQEEAEAMSRRHRNPMWTLDRGSGYYHTERQKHNRAYLVETGRWAGGGRRVAAAGRLAFDCLRGAGER